MPPQSQHLRPAKARRIVQLLAATVLLVTSAACGRHSADISRSDKAETPAVAEAWPQPDPAALEDSPRKQEVLYGEALIRSTYAYLGPDVADAEMRFAGNHLACGSCHLDAGRKRLEHRVTPDSDLLALFRHGDAAETTGNASGAST